MPCMLCSGKCRRVPQRLSLSARDSNHSMHRSCAQVSKYAICNVHGAAATHRTLGKFPPMSKLRAAKPGRQASGKPAHTCKALAFLSSSMHTRRLGAYMHVTCLYAPHAASHAPKVLKLRKQNKVCPGGPIHVRALFSLAGTCLHAHASGPLPAS